MRVATFSAPSRGFTYVGILVLLAVLSLGSALTLEVAQTNAQRSAEAELLAIGKEFERAFASYYRQSPANSRRYPERLEDLTRDPRSVGLRRHLRRVYVDPLTGGDWGLIPAPGGGIMAVYSKSTEKPYRDLTGSLAVPAASSPLAEAEPPATYANWRFGYDPANDFRNTGAIIRPTPLRPPTTNIQTGAPTEVAPGI